MASIVSYVVISSHPRISYIDMINNPIIDDESTSPLRDPRQRGMETRARRTHREHELENE